MSEREPRRGVPLERMERRIQSDDGRDADFWIERLCLRKHPEGGYYRRTYRAEAMIAAGCHPGGHDGPRAVLSCIDYLLEGHDFSAFHALKSWEVWNFHHGGTVLLHVISPEGRLTTHRLGLDLANGESFREVIEPGSWFAAELADRASYALLGCVVSPGFEYEDWILADRGTLLTAFPAHRPLIERLTRRSQSSRDS